MQPRNVKKKDVTMKSAGKYIKRVSCRFTENKSHLLKAFRWPMRI